MLFLLAMLGLLTCLVLDGEHIQPPDRWKDTDVSLQKQNEEKVKITWLQYYNPNRFSQMDIYAWTLSKHQGLFKK